MPAILVSTVDRITLHRFFGFSLDSYQLIHFLMTILIAPYSCLLLAITYSDHISIFSHGI